MVNKSEMYCLKWNSYKNYLYNGFAELQQSEEYVDMTLVAEGHQVKVHKNLVSMASPYIKNVIKTVPCTHPIIFLTNITQKMLGQLLEYIYTGQVHIEKAYLNTFVKAAIDLQLPGIAKYATDPVGLNTEKVKNVPKTNQQNQTLDDKKLKHGSVDALKTTTNDSNIIDDIEMRLLDNTNNTNISFASTLSKGSVSNALKTKLCKTYQPRNRKKLKQNNGEAVTTNDISNIGLVAETPPTKNDNKPPARILITNTQQGTNTPEPLPTINYPTTSNSVQTLDNRTLNLGNDEANTRNITVATKMLPANNYDNKPRARILINQQSMNTPQTLPTSNYHTTPNSIQILDNRLLDYGMSENTAQTNNLINVPETNASPQNQSLPVLDDAADNLDEYLKFPDPPNSTASAEEISSTSQSQQIQLIDLRNKETKLTLDLGTKIIPQQYTVSKRGSLQLILNRCIYQMHSANTDAKRRWRCIDYHRMQCPAYVETEDDQITNIKHYHNHPCHDYKILKKIKANLVFGSLGSVIKHRKLMSVMPDSVLNSDTDSE